MGNAPSSNINGPSGADCETPTHFKPHASALHTITRYKPMPSSARKVRAVNRLQAIVSRGYLLDSLGIQGMLLATASMRAQSRHKYVRIKQEQNKTIVVARVASTRL